MLGKLFREFFGLTEPEPKPANPFEIRYKGRTMKEHFDLGSLTAKEALGFYTEVVSFGYCEEGQLHQFFPEKWDTRGQRERKKGVLKNYKKELVKYLEDRSVEPQDDLHLFWDIYPHQGMFD